MMLNRLMCLSAALLFVVACGGDENDKKNNSNNANGSTNNASNAGTNNASNSASNSNTTPNNLLDMGGPGDMGTPSDMGADAAGVDAGGDMGADMGVDMAPPTCDRTGLLPVQESGTWDELNKFYLYSAYNADPMAGGMYDFLSFEIYPYFGGATLPQQYTFPDLNYADCGTCLLIFADCMMGQGCSKTFLVQSGEVALSAIDRLQDAPFQAVFSDLILREVTIDPVSFMSTRVPDGEVYCIETLAASTTTDAINLP